METFAAPKNLIDNPNYQAQKKKSLAAIKVAVIDLPIIDLVNDLNQLPHCFTLQCCYGHFVCDGREDPHNLEPLPSTKTVSEVEYRIAYIAFCIENSTSGRRLLAALKEMTAIDPENIQLCSAEWFWERQVNSFALQVEPDRFKHKDQAVIGYREALQVEKIKNEFFVRLAEIVKDEARLLEEKES